MPMRMRPNARSGATHLPGDHRRCGARSWRGSRSTSMRPLRRLARASSAGDRRPTAITSARIARRAEAASTHGAAAARPGGTVTAPVRHSAQPLLAPLHTRSLLRSVHGLPVNRISRDFVGVSHRLQAHVEAPSLQVDRSAIVQLPDGPARHHASTQVQLARAHADQSCCCNARSGAAER